MPREPLLTRPFLLAFVAHLMHAMAFHLYLHLPGYLKLQGAGEDRIGIIYGVTAATAIVARPALGRAIDRRGTRPVILGGGLLATLSCALYLTVHGIGPWTYVVRIVHGVSEAMLFASLFALAAEVVPASRRIEGIALFGVSGMLPMAFGGLLGDLILARAPYSALFITAAVLSAVGLLVSLPLPAPVLHTDRPPSRGFVAALVQRDLLPLWFVGISFAIVVVAPSTFLKTYVMARGTGSVGGFFAAYALTAVGLRIVLGSLPERIGPKRVLIPGFFLLAGGLGLLATDPEPLVLLLAGVLCGVGHGYGFPIVLGLVVTRAPASERGAALSIYTALFDGGMLLGGPLLGAIIRAAGYREMFTLTMLIAVVGTLIFALWDRQVMRPAA